MLCIDVSGSMDGRPILEAAQGARDFVAEAVSARYKVGVMLWNTGIVALAGPSADGAEANRLLASGIAARGGTSLLAPLQRCHQILHEFPGDRVVAIFGDGDLGPEDLVLAKVAQMKADDIRFVTRGLGAAAAQDFARVSSADPSEVEVHDIDNLATGIAGMATSLSQRSSSSTDYH